MHQARKQDPSLSITMKTEKTDVDESTLNSQVKWSRSTCETSPSISCNDQYTRQCLSDNRRQSNVNNEKHMLDKLSVLTSIDNSKV
jgi:hypothetical protein